MTLIYHFEKNKIISRLPNVTFTYIPCSRDVYILILYEIKGYGSYTSGDDRNTIFKNPQVRVLGRSKFYNNMVTQKGNASVPQCMAENDFIKGPSL